MIYIAILPLLSTFISASAAPTASQECSAPITESYAATFNWSSPAALTLAKCLINTRPPNNTCIFYTSNSKPLALRYAFESNRTTIYDVYSPVHFDVSVDPMKRWNASGHQRDVFKITSKAYALSCSGQASIVMPENEEACPHSIWVTDEYEVIKSGESAIELPVWRVSWVQDAIKKSWGWAVSVLSQVGKRDVRLQQAALDGQAAEQVREKIERLRMEWGVDVDDEKEDMWAVRHGRCAV